MENKEQSEKERKAEEKKRLYRKTKKKKRLYRKTKKTQNARNLAEIGENEVVSRL